MFRFEGLDIWKKSIAFSHKLYDIADVIPKEEMFGLGSQLRRAAVSIPSNIAERSGNASTKDFLHFLDIAIKSILEVVSLPVFAEGRRYNSGRQKQTLYLYQEAVMLVRQIRVFRSSFRSTISH